MPDASKRVIVIASGETERRALPHLVRCLRGRGIVVDDVRIPPSNRPLTPDMATNLIKATWYETSDAQPDKFVVVVDTDRKEPNDVLQPFRERLPAQVHGVTADVLCAYAQEHLEAWYFADADNLRPHVGRNLGSVDTSKPDGIQNPKSHLKNILGDRVYTARVSEEIARRLDAGTIAQRSPSFKGFLDAVANGSGGG